jgi:flagellar basal body-associated protein FliL
LNYLLYFTGTMFRFVSVMYGFCQKKVKYLQPPAGKLEVEMNKKSEEENKMRNEVKNRMKKLMKKTESAIENVKGLLNGREQGGAVVTLIVVGFFIVTVVTIVVVAVHGAGEANKSSSAAWKVVDQQSQPVDPKVYKDAQDATGKSQMKQAGDVLKGGISGDTLASPSSSVAPSAPINLDTAMSAGQLGTQLVDYATSDTSSGQQPPTTGSDLDNNTKVNQVGDGAASGMGGGNSGGGCSDGCSW